MFINPFDTQAQNISGIGALFGIGDKNASRSPLETDAPAGGDSVSISDEGKRLAEAYREALGMDSNGKFNLNRNETDSETMEAIQKELEDLTRKLAELASQPQTAEVRQAMNDVRQQMENLKKSGKKTA